MVYKNIKKKEGQEGPKEMFILNFINMLESSCDNELSFLKVLLRKYFTNKL